jgi:hypothetical protein
MRYSLLTPTILRESLVRLCASIDAQTSNDWEHVVVVDTPLVNDVLSRISHPRRVVLRCDHQHGDWGHHCRHNVWPTLTGDYVWCLDDDNYVADENVLRDLEVVTGPWAIFPILRYGERFFNDPPGLRRTDTGSFIVRRELGPWPDLPNYETDGIFVESLLANHPYQLLSDLRPLMVMLNSGGP